MLPQLLPGGAWSEQLLTQHAQQRLLERIELARPQPAAVGQARRRTGRDRGRAIEGVLHAPAQAGAGQPHGGAGPTAAIHRDVEGGPAATDGDRAQSPAGEVEPQRAQAGGAAETEAHGNQRVGSQEWPEQGSGCRVDAAVRKSMRPAQQEFIDMASRPVNADKNNHRSSDQSHEYRECELVKQSSRFH